MATEKVLSRARKLKALANAGEGGEQENAQRMYEAYIKEHNIEDCEINFSMNVREIDDIANTTEADIAYTILLSVNPYAKCSFSGNVMSTELDDEDYVEAKEKIKYFLTLWRLEVNALKGAFSLRHNEFFKPDEHALKKWRDNNVGQSQWSQEVAKQESKDIYDLSEKIKDGFEKDHKQAINDILTSKDDVYVSAFNLDRSVEMSQLLLLADYVRANKTIDNNVRKN